MNDKTLGEYKRTTPDPDETTGEALARLQATLTRLLDEADAELRDEADGGVAAALIEEEAEQRACPDLDAHWRLDEAMDRAERAERERDEWKDSAIKAMADLERAEHPRPLTPDAMTARQHLDAAWEAAHVPTDGTIPAGAEYIMRSHRTGRIVTPAYGKAWADLPAMEPTHESRLLGPPTPARPEGAEELARLIATADVGEWDCGDLADALLATGRVRVVTEEQP